MITAHYVKIRQHPQYKHAMIRVYIEANMSFINADHIAQYLQTTPGLQGDLFKVVRFDPQDQGRFGIWTTPASKEKWVLELKRCIDGMQTVKAEHFISSMEPSELVPDVSQRQVDLLCEQLERYRLIMATPKGKPEDSMQLYPRFTSTGKSAGKTDDRVAVAGIGLVCMMADCFSNSTLSDEMRRLHLPMIAATAA